ncbi:MAG: vitamin K epoxide reductase family protein [Verrucomicrobiota bacterium]|nr:vitamin K epoxide reductase family protein [Verrucomicrobiota bacterium]
MIAFFAALLGLWLIASPATFGYTQHILAWSDWISGALLLFLGLFLRTRTIATWSYALIGLWLGFAPLAFWAPNVAAYLNETTAGVLAIALFLSLPAWPRQLPDTGPSIPPGWSYNPSSWPQRLPIAFLAFLGWMFSRYMAAYQLGYIHTMSDPFFPDGTLHVITSDVSKAFPIPDAGLGALAYSLEMLSTFKGGDRRWRTMPWMVLVFGLLAIPLSLTSVILILLQPLIVGAWCTWCLLTAFCMLILMALSLDEVIATLQYLRYSKEKPLLPLLFQGGLCPSAKADTRTPSLDAPLHTLLKASAWGLTFPWTLLAAALLSACLMFIPNHFALRNLIQDLDHAIGALLIVTSMVSFSEIARPLRWLNLPLAAAIALTALLTTSGPSFWAEFLLCLAIALLSIPRGEICEKTTWK